MMSVFRYVMRSCQKVDSVRMRSGLSERDSDWTSPRVQWSWPSEIYKLIIAALLVRLISANVNEPTVLKTIIKLVYV